MMGGECGNPTVDESTPAESSAAVSLSTDTIFELLANAERRFLLEMLMEESDSAVAIEDLTTQLVEWETAQTGDRPSRDEIRTRLHHGQLAKLVDAGIVDYDARSGDLRYRCDERLEAWLRRARAEATETE